MYGDSVCVVMKIGAKKRITFAIRESRSMALATTTNRKNTAEKKYTTTKRKTTGTKEKFAR